MVAEHRSDREGDVTLEEDPPASTTQAESAELVIDIRGEDPVVGLVRSDRSAPTGLLAASRGQLFLKRAIDVAGSLVGLIVLAPVLLATSIAVLLTSGRPIFYVSDRVGKDGKIFRFVKFRTMKSQAAYEKPELIDLNEVDGPIFKIKDDPRVTPLGQRLRRYSIDEFPQLIHVLTGKMSLVGPRPPIPEEVAEYTEYHRRRLEVKPGLTCLWQVQGRSDLDFETWVKLDLEYIENWTPLLDLVLMVRTVPAVLSGRGAY